MNIGKPTLEILKNFGTINSGMLFREGNTLRTISAGKNIFAVAEIEEEFPLEFGIYDLNSLLSLLTMADDEDGVDFGEKSLKISKGDGVFEYYYADPSVLTVAPSKTIAVDNQFTFALTKADVEMITKAAAIVSAATINIVSRKGTVTLTVGDPDTASSNSYRRVIGKSKYDFDCRLAIENFRVIPLDYTVILSAKKVIYFRNTERKLEYWLALDPKSVISAHADAVEEDDEDEAPAPKKQAKKAPVVDEDEEEDVKPKAKKKVVVEEEEEEEELPKKTSKRK